MDWSGRVRCCTSRVAFVEAAGDRLIALHAPDVEPFPFSVVVPAGPRTRGLAPGAPVRAAAGVVWIGGRPHRAAPVPVEPVRRACDVAGLRDVLAQCRTVRRRRADLGAVLRDALGALRRGRHERAVELLLGWGPGLTPSGDDVLVGLVAADALRPGAWGARELLACAVPAARARTTFVSRALLEAAAAGAFAPALAALGGDRPGPRDVAIARIARVGSHSGADLLVGIEEGLRLAG